MNEQIQLRGERNVSSPLRPLTRVESVQPVLDNPTLPEDPPKWLEGAHNKDARRWWRRIVTLAGELPIYRETDAPGMVLLVEALARQERLFRECAGQEVLPESVDFATGKVTPSRINPAFTAAQKERASAMKLLDQFGMTPTARSRLMLELMGASHLHAQTEKKLSEREKVGQDFLRIAGKV